MYICHFSNRVHLIVLAGLTDVVKFLTTFKGSSHLSSQLHLQYIMISCLFMHLCFYIFIFDYIFVLMVLLSRFVSMISTETNIFEHSIV